MEDICTFEGPLFLALFVSVATLAFTASLYLLLRRGNAFALEIDPPRRLRRWTAAFLAAAGFSQLCWLFIYYGPMPGDLFDRALICQVLDTMFSTPLIMCTMIVMLQDRRRVLWPIFAGMALYLGYLLMLYIFDIRNTVYFGVPLLVYFLIFGAALVHAVRQYDRWLLENYADLEHKEVRTSFIVLAAFILCAIAYSLAYGSFFFEVFIEVANILLFAALLWRVETLQNLEEPADDDAEDDPAANEDSLFSKIDALLQQHCIDKQYYLQYDATLNQLAKLIGTNRNYLSQHFSKQGLTYNSYINGLRIEHFIRLYEECVSNGQLVVATDLAKRCGFRSYSTFSRAFKQQVGQPVTEWMAKRS